MFRNIFREFESDPFYDFGNSPFSRSPFLRQDPEDHSTGRRRAQALPPARPASVAEADAAATQQARSDDQRREDVAGRQLERYDVDAQRQRRRDLMERDDPFGFPALMGGPGGFTAMERHFNHMFDGMHRMMADMGDRMRQMEAAAARDDFDGHMYSHASVYSSSRDGPDAEPHVYQAMSETRAGPGGVRETRRAMRDSRSREERMAHGRHLGERGHVVERRRNTGTGDQRENHSYAGVDEVEGDAFDQEWQSRATALARGVGGGGGGVGAGSGSRALPEQRRRGDRPLAIESSGGGSRHKL